MEYSDFNDYELLDYIAEGNEDANNILLEKYQPLISNIASQMLKYCYNNGYEYSDLKQEGMIGLTHAINTFSDQKNAIFYTYAKTCIKRKIISAVVSSRRLKHKILNDSVSYDSDDNFSNSIFMKDDRNNPEDIIISLDVEDHLIHSIQKKLTDFEDQVFQLMLSQFTYREIADILEKDPKSVDNAIQRIRIKVRDAMKKGK